MEGLLDGLDLAREFSFISARGDVPYHKPDPRVFFHPLSTLELKCGATREQCVFVGDTPADILAGQAAGVRTLVVQTGPYLLKHAALHPMPLGDILRSVDDLPLWVEENHEGSLSILAC